MNKPTKNRVMCPDCRRMKMLFETESKARNFIKFNGDEIETGGAELRVYYCPACCGYHISSKKHSRFYDHHTDYMIDNYKRHQGRKVDMVDVAIMAGRIIQTFPRKPTYTRGMVKKYIDKYFVDNPDSSKLKGNARIRHEIYKRFNMLKSKG